jgi:hypothetical protein
LETPGGLWQGVEHFQTPGEVPNRLHMRGTRNGTLAGPLPVPDSGLAKPCLGVVMGHQLGFGLYRLVEHLQARRVTPVRIFKDEQHGLVVREPDELVDECRDRLLFQPLGTERQWGIAVVGRNRQQRRNQRGNVCHPFGALGAGSASSLPSLWAGVSSRANRAARSSCAIGRVRQVTEHHRERRRSVSGG